jgi:hypothetical protein
LYVDINNDVKRLKDAKDRFDELRKLAEQTD